MIRAQAGQDLTIGGGPAPARLRAGNAAPECGERTPVPSGSRSHRGYGLRHLRWIGLQEAWIRERRVLRRSRAAGLRVLLAGGRSGSKTNGIAGEIDFHAIDSRHGLANFVAPCGAQARPLDQTACCRFVYATPSSPKSAPPMPCVQGGQNMQRDVPRAAVWGTRLAKRRGEATGRWAAGRCLRGVRPRRRRQRFRPSRCRGIPAFRSPGPGRSIARPGSLAPADWRRSKW